MPIQNQLTTTTRVTPTGAELKYLSCTTTDSIREVTEKEITNGKGESIFAKFVSINSSQFVTGDFTDVTVQEMYRLTLVTKQIHAFASESFEGSNKKIKKIIQSCFGIDSPNRDVAITFPSN